MEAWLLFFQIRNFTVKILNIFCQELQESAPKKNAHVLRNACVTAEGSGRPTMVQRKDIAVKNSPFY